MLRVALEELASLSDPAPTAKIYGADIDGAAADWAAHLVSQGVPAENLRASDFLTLAPGKELPLVAAVVGNPPYVRHHRMSALAHRRATAAAEAAGVPLSGRASLWAYFVVHACRFLEPGGRMALLLPGAVLQADYASAVLRYVERRFTDIMLIRVAERIFEDAAEETVVLLGSNAQDPMDVEHTAAPSRFTEVTNLEQLQQLLAKYCGDKPTKPESGSEIEGIAPWKAQAIQPECLDLIAEILKHKHVCKLGDIARVSLGTVTGANDFFLLRDADASQLGVLNNTMLTVSRSAWITGPMLSSTSLAQVSNSSRRRLLVLPQNHIVNPQTKLDQYIKKGERQKLPDRRKCQRDPWWSLGSVSVPDAFLPYTVGYPRGIAVNTARAASTNTIHQITWTCEPDQALANSWALSTWSALGRLCVELFGRHYGGGVLKLELADAQRLPVVAGLQVSRKAPAIYSQSAMAARIKADSALISSPLKLTSREVALLQAGALSLAEKRRMSTENGLGKTKDPIAAGDFRTTSLFSQEKSFVRLGSLPSDPWRARGVGHLLGRPLKVSKVSMRLDATPLSAWACLFLSNAHPGNLK